MNRNIRYKKYCFAYLDILGFEDHVQDQGNLTRLVSLLESFHDSKTTEKKTFKSTESGGKATIIPNVMCFSDNIIVSIQDDKALSKNGFPVSQEYNSLMCSISIKVQEMCIRSLLEGMALRGAIGYGDMYIDNSKSIIFGPGLIESIRDEQKKAKYPRIMISKSLLDVLDKPPPSPIIHDSSDHKDIYHIDYLIGLDKFIFDGEATAVKKIADFIALNHNNAHTEVKDKWAWLIDYYNSKIDDLISKHSPDNSKCEFTKCKHPTGNDLEKLKIKR